MADLRFELEKYRVKDQIDKSRMTAILSLFPDTSFCRWWAGSGRRLPNLPLPSISWRGSRRSSRNYVKNACRSGGTRQTVRWMRRRILQTTNTKLGPHFLRRFQKISAETESTLFTGINGSGKIHDSARAATHHGNTQFNKAAKDRTVRYWAMSGDTKRRCCPLFASGEVISYIAMEFDDPVAGAPLVVGVWGSNSSDETAKPSRLRRSDQFRLGGKGIRSGSRRK